MSNHIVIMYPCLGIAGYIYARRNKAPGTNDHIVIQNGEVINTVYLDKVSGIVVAEGLTHDEAENEIERLIEEDTKNGRLSGRAGTKFPIPSI